MICVDPVMSFVMAECPHGVIKMLSANHGRRLPSTVQCPSTPAVTTTCYRDLLSTFKSDCDNKNNCDVYPDFTYPACPLNRTQMIFEFFAYCLYDYY